MISNSSPITIRRVEVNDAGAVADLCGQLGYETTPQQAEERLRLVVDQRGHEFLVASLTDGSIVGWIHVFLAHRIESPAFSELGGLVVTAAHRRKGIGKQLLAAAEEWSARQHVTKLRVRSRAGRLDAHAFYQRGGFARTKTQDVFDKILVISAARSLED